MQSGRQKLRRKYCGMEDVRVYSAYYTKYIRREREGSEVLGKTVDTNPEEAM